MGERKARERKRKQGRMKMRKNDRNRDCELGERNEAAQKERLMSNVRKKR